MLPTMKRHLIWAGTALTGVILTACSSSGTASDSATTSGPASSAVSQSVAATASAASTASAQPIITISSFRFSGNLTVRAGQKVTVSNKDSAAHTLTDAATHLFDTGKIAGSGGTGTFTAPKKAGTYQFGCTYHPNMAGTLTVTG